jgi:phosphatidylserine/phosphatidylglycerophosphate/cardiolipin synthase-like enzyme
MGTTLDPKRPDDSLAVQFIAEGWQSAADVAHLIAEFISRAERTLDIAIYDCHLDEDAAEPIRTALHGRERAGVRIRLVYDRSFRKPQSFAQFDQVGGDFADEDTHQRVEELGLPGESTRAVEGEGLMHQKYMIRDSAAVWTGSMNWSNDSMSRMENTLVDLLSPEIAAYFARDFEQLWSSGRTTESGSFRTEPVTLRYAGAPANTDADFSPGQGQHINEWVAKRVLRAERRIVFCSMLINSSKLLIALMDVLDRRGMELWGVYDRTQMEGVLHQWGERSDLRWKVDAVHRLLATAEMVGKRSIPYRPGQSHNFMHNKLLIVDETVVTGSYNLSHAAQANAENMLAITSHQLAEDAVGYVQTLRNRFLDDPVGRSS